MVMKIPQELSDLIADARARRAEATRTAEVAEADGDDATAARMRDEAQATHDEVVALTAEAELIAAQKYPTLTDRLRALVRKVTGRR